MHLTESSNDFFTCNNTIRYQNNIIFIIWYYTVIIAKTS